jgi:demethylmenaquinone methyltransferase / 2-methoxy-6-polyprenyl-1,4-benzoquinol methylase
LFAGIAPQYDVMSTLWSFGQDGRWRRFLVSRVPSGSRVLDVATGTGMVARELETRGCRVVGLDQSDSMLRYAETNATPFVQGQAERLPFRDASFDAVTFTYLLRYVDDPAATVAELGRVVNRGGTMACLEFHIPTSRLWRSAWWLYTRGVMPITGRFASRAWYGAGRFLGPSITGFYRSHPLVVQGAWWREAGFEQVRYRTMTLGGGIVIWGRKRG